MEELNNILKNFKLPFAEYQFSSISNGLINDTYLVEKNEEPLYILQRINTNVFSNVKSLIHNIDLILPLLHGSDYKEIVLAKTESGKSFYKTNTDEIWRLMTFIKDSQVFNTTTNPDIAYESGKIIGLFHEKTKGFNVELLEDTLPKFHNLNYRYDQFKTAFVNAKTNNIQTAQKAIDFVNNNISKLLEINFKDLPVKVCHNDTKLNNILFSQENKALCLIDLDTIMQGAFLYDFGDAVRTIVNAAPEDETSLERINFDINLFDAFVKGLKKHKNILNKKEIELLSLGPVLMPFLHGIRALTDYLENNRYYKVSYETQNLDRCISLFTFSQLALNNQDYMKKIIEDQLL